MKRQPTFSDRLMFVAAKWHAGRVYQGFLDAARHATRVQEQVLRGKLRSNADSAFGRDYRLDRVGSPEAISKLVPILRYEDHEPYIERVKSGDLRAMLGPRERVHMFALSSGTTDRPKAIPVTTSFLREYRQGWNAFGVKALLDHPWGFLRGIVQVSSRMDETTTAAGIPCGAITGLMAATQKRLVRRYYITPKWIAEIDDALAKYYTIMRLAVPDDPAFLITANPATQLKLAQTADEHRERLIRDIHDGSLWPDLPVPGHVREALRPRIKAEPEAARFLERLAAEHGALLPKHYWNLAFLANWTGGTLGLYLQAFGYYFGEVPVRDIGLLATEGRVSVPIDDNTPAGILDVTSHFFEFVPRDLIDDVNPEALRSHEVKVGQEYFVLMTTSSGLWRYDLHDLVRVVDFFGEAPVIEFLNKGQHVCSLTGEKLTEHQVVLAMERASRELGTMLPSFVLAPRWDDPPQYVLHAEAPVPHAEAALARLAVAMDRQLQAVSVEYASKRKSLRLGPVRGNALPAGFLDAWDMTEAESKRSGNMQYKHRYLYCQPGEDAAFPGATETVEPASPTFSGLLAFPRSINNRAPRGIRST